MILLLAAFMNLLDVSIVNIAIPSIQRNLHASYADVQWALVGYTLAYALVLITGGRLGDTFGRKRLFMIGVIGFTITAALLLLLYPLVQGRQLGWPAWTFVSMAASVPVFALILTLFLQIGLGFTPLHAGLTFLPFSGGVLVASGAAARLAPRFGRGVTMTGALVMAAGMVGLIAIVGHYAQAVTTWEMVPGLVVAGLGMGTVLAPLADILLAGVPRQHAGSASGLLNTAIQLGASIGIAVIGVIFFGMLGSQSGPASAAVAPQLRTGLAAAGVPAQLTSHIVTQFRGCLHARLVAADPTVTPADCRHAASAQVLPAAADRVIAGIGGSAVRRDFAASLERTLWSQVGVFLLSFVLMLALPAGSGRRSVPHVAPGGAVGAIGPGASALEGAVHA